MKFSSISNIIKFYIPWIRPLKSPMLWYTIKGVRCLVLCKFYSLAHRRICEHCLPLQTFGYGKYSLNIFNIILQFRKMNAWTRIFTGGPELTPS